jgi:hypothetical protein
MTRHDLSKAPINDFEIRFYAPHRGAPHPRFDRFEEGVEQAYEYLKDPLHADFALVVGPVERGTPVPNLLLERKPDVGVLIQLYLPERISPAGEDGYYNLVEPENLNRVSIKDVSTIYEEPDRKDMVQTRLSEGVLFSKRMYVRPKVAEDALKSYLESRNLNDMLKTKPWKFIGLI